MADLDAILADLEMAAERRRYNKLAFFKPYPKQWQFIQLTSSVSEAALFAGNQVGKSDIGAYITACHMTGRYPKGWNGRRYDKVGLRGWVCGPDGKSVRDIEQKKLLGTPGVEEDKGTGMIPRDCIIKTTPSRSAPDAIDTVQVRHANGSIATFSFKTYDQLRVAWQGDPVDFIWADEEPPADLYSEAQARMMAVRGSVICTFTPLEGMARVVPLFLHQSNEERAWMRMAMLDALHFTEEDVRKARLQYPRHEWDARIDGKPKLGSGHVFDTDEENIRWRVPAHIPDEWLKIWGVDFGIDHPFAAALCAWDRDDDTFYVLNGFRVRNELVLQHIKRIRDLAGNVPVAWPHDGHVRDRSSGEAMAELYKDNGRGLLMLDEHAKLPDGTNSLYASVQGINEWMHAGRFRVNAALSDWFEEYGNYHYKDGVIVKLMDDFLSATRYAWMMRRRGRVGPILPAGLPNQKQRKPITSFDLYTGRPFPEGDPRRYQ